ncbi:MAG: hypothetical protein HUK22_02060, partial [Thermoguttaceae bacterium]|nr:hypothetical protein [Thermoguttaceae bacterium]
RIALQKLLYADSKTPILFALGNHDHNNGGRDVGGYITSEDWASVFVEEMKTRGLDVVAGGNGSYYYVDFPAKKMRFIALNSSDDGYYGYSVEQLQFLADSLASAPADYTVAIVEHFCVLFKLGYWKNSMSAKAKRDALCMGIFDAFVAGTDGEEDGVVWKFSERGKGVLTGVFHGDSHFDNFTTINGVNYIIHQGYGGVDVALMAEGAVYRRFNRAETMLIDVVAIKTATREVKIFRVGAGGANADRSFTY